MFFGDIGDARAGVALDFRGDHHCLSIGEWHNLQLAPALAALKTLELKVVDDRCLTRVRLRHEPTSSRPADRATDAPPRPNRRPAGGLGPASTNVPNGQNPRRQRRSEQTARS